MTDRELIQRITRAPGQRAGYKTLVRELGLGGGRERRLLLEQLARITARGELIKLDSEQWGIPRAVSARDQLAAGRLDLHRDGYGFVRPEIKQASGDGDIFIPPDAMSGAMQGDQVLVELGPSKSDGRKLGRIVRILMRRNATIVGTFHYARSERASGNYVRPFDTRMTQPVLIAYGDEIPAEGAAEEHRVLGEEVPVLDNEDDLEGMVVDVEILEWPTATRPAKGRVMEILGLPDDFGVDVEMMIRKHQLPRVFPPEVIAEAREVAHLDPEEVVRREDFRSLPIVTIDGETARDFDDAVMVTETATGYELQVHIADVSEYVRAGSRLDLEARLRGTSVYFPDRAIPMLPQELSTDICSLRPAEDRLVLSCLMQLDSDARIVSYRIVEGVIRSAARMTYTKVHKILEGDEELRTEYAPLVADFERMKALALKLNARRSKRGSIDFDMPEPLIEFDEFGAMKGVSRSERNWAHRLIEEFMLAANECVATWIEDLGVPSLYRIHEKPDGRRIADFEEIAAAFGYSLGLGSVPVKKITFKADRREQRGTGKPARTHEIAEEAPVTPKMYQRLTAKLEGKPEERILTYLMLRSLKQARYSERNEGHFALAAPTYTHFTSPIRRYPDLIVHRIAKALLARGIAGEGSIAEDRHASPWQHISEHQGLFSVVPRAKAHFEGEPPVSEIELEMIGNECSQNERRAAEAERELVEWKKIKFMQDRVGEEFAAMILNPAKFGLFVELEEMFIEGLIPIETLPGDRYTYRENTREIIGDRTGRKFRAGLKVQVILDRVLADDRRLQFALVEEEGAGKASGGRNKVWPQMKYKKQMSKSERRAKGSKPTRGPRPPKKGKKSSKNKGKRRKPSGT
jgi:ribonuclease R